MTRKTYPSKVLIFGEYTVLMAGQALAVPYLRYSGRWTNARQSYQTNHFGELGSYLIKINTQLHAALDLQEFHSAVQHGATFQSNIPQGVGLGSSAALTAAIYDRYSDHSKLSLEQKKFDLGHIESFYHGRSSGFDALVSLQQNPIAVEEDDQLIELQRVRNQATKVYVLFSIRPRRTQELVTWFEDSSRVGEFNEQMISLAEINKEAIKQLRQGNSVLQLVKEISMIQYRWLQPLVSAEIKALWNRTLTDENMAMKLLGAGGGGCYLVFSDYPLGSKDVDGFIIEEIDF